MANVENMTDAERKAFAKRLRSRMKSEQAAVKAYNKVMREKPVK